MDPVSARIMDKLLQGTLPAADPLKLWARYGTGLLCDGCDVAITSNEQEHEVEMPNGRRLRFHDPCHALWRALKESRPGRSNYRLAVSKGTDRVNRSGDGGVLAFTRLHPGLAG